MVDWDGVVSGLGRLEPSEMTLQVLYSLEKGDSLLGTKVSSGP